MDKKTLQLKLIEKIANPSYLDSNAVALANHVKDCKFCLNLLDEASLKCLDHFKEKQND